MNLLLLKQLSFSIQKNVKGVGVAAVMAVALLGGGNASAQALSGTYTICASGCSYSTIGAAVTDLKSKGISAAVTFNIGAGNWNEGISFTSGVTGSSAAKTITWNGAGRTTRLYATTTRVIDVNNVSYMNFQNMMVEATATSGNTYAVYNTYTNYVNFKNMDLRNRVGSSTCYVTNNSYTNYTTYDNVTVRGGYFGVYTYGTTDVDANFTFKNGRITKAYYYLTQNYYLETFEYSNNYIDSGGLSYAFGLSMPYCAGATINNNIMPLYNVAYGIYCYDYYYNGDRTKPMTLKNNMVGNASTTSPIYYYPFYYYSYSYSTVFTVQHNTFVLSPATYSYYAMLISTYNYSGSATPTLDMRNNNFISYPSGGTPCYLEWPLTVDDSIEGNNFYEPNGIAVNVYDPNTYTSTIYDIASWKSFMNPQGKELLATSVIPNWKSVMDLHLDQTKGAPYGKAIKSNLKDIDGDQRCVVFPTIGADENNFGKTKGTVGFGTPTNVFKGTPTTIYNIGISTEPKAYKWYVDGKYVTDSFHLRTTSLNGPTNKVKLVMVTCAGNDSIEKTITVNTPTVKPITDFIANKNVIRSGEVITFRDLSTNGPNKWQWTITPDSIIDNGLKVPRFKYVYGDSKNDIISVRFLYGGKYKICLTSANDIGAGTQECKVNYIDVTPSFNFGAVSVIKDGSGYIYDEGGPNGAYPYNYNVKTMTIDPCADSVYMIINYYDTYCGEGYLRLFEGKDNTGTELHNSGNLACSSVGYGYGPGFNGSTANPSNCFYNCTPNKNGIKDTFKASKAIFMEWNANYNDSYAGFEIFYWSKPTSQAKPVAKFTSIDTSCTGGFVTFTNASKGDDISYLWDLDGDLSTFEYTSNKSAIWPYLLPNTYAITLITTNCGGADTFRKNIVVLDPPKPKPVFMADNTNPGVGETVKITNTTKECIDNFTYRIYKTKNPKGAATWAYVNGTGTASSNPLVIFNDTGVYTIILKGENVTGTDSTIRLNYITVKNPYCVPSVATIIKDIGISKVSFNTISNTSAQGVSAYENFLVTQSTTVELGVKYTLKVERGTANNTAVRAVFIDWNGDGVFASTETVATETAGKNLAWTYDITIPNSAKIGATVMRIAINQGNFSNQVCGQNEFGEYEDYRLYVSADITKPVLTKVGMDTVRIEQGQAYNEPGFTALDNLDGVITNNVVITSAPKFNVAIPGTYVLTYNASDAAGNKATSFKRVVIIGKDKTGPNLVISSPDTLKIGVNKIYTRFKIISALDLVDGDLTTAVTVVDNVRTDKPAVFTNVYSVSDFSGNTRTVTRTVIVIDTIAPFMVLKGQDTTLLDVYAIYSDSGVNTIDEFYTGYSNVTLQGLVKVSSNLDNTKLGTYTQVYDVTDPSGNKAKSVRRYIKVVDRTAPVLTLKGDTASYVDFGSKYVETGINISDNYDKNITAYVTGGTYGTTFGTNPTNKLGRYTVTYTVTDASGNKSTITRAVYVRDNVAPVLVLKGEPTVDVCRWTNYVDAGVTVTDNETPVAQVAVSQEGNFVTSGTSKPGLYSTRYKGVDRSGNIGYSEYRIITVKQVDGGDCKVLSITNQKGLEKAVTVYPNPNAGNFNIQLDLNNSERVTIQVINSLGEIVTTVNNGNAISQGTYAIDMSTQPAGVYFVQVRTGGANITKRVVIQK